MELFGKKLLVLGGNALTCDIVNTAKRLGVYVIVTDWNEVEVSPAKQIADEYMNVSYGSICRFPSMGKSFNILILYNMIIWNNNCTV